MKDDVSCPYCGEPQEIVHDDGYGYEEGVLHQQECGLCEKTFVYNTTILFYYDAYEADCLNGGEHDWQMPMKNQFDFITDQEERKKAIKNHLRPKCKQCDEYRQLTDQEVNEIYI